MSVATSQLSEGSYKSYHAKITQSSTSAPTSTVYFNNLGATLTWARSSTGVYTITAGSAVFTSTKTHILIQPPQATLVNYFIVPTSTSVLTLTTGLLAAGVAVVTDALLTNTLIEIRVYN